VTTTATGLENCAAWHATTTANTFNTSAGKTDSQNMRLIALTSRMIADSGVTIRLKRPDANIFMRPPLPQGMSKL